MSFDRLLRAVTRALAVMTASVLLCGQGPAQRPAPTAVLNYVSWHDGAPLHRTGDIKPGAPIEFPGFTILPPSGDNWIENTRLTVPDKNTDYMDLMIFGKLVPQKDPQNGLHSVIAKVARRYFTEQELVLVKKAPREYLIYMQGLIEEELKAGERLKFMSGSVRSDTTIGDLCLRHNFVARDVGVPGFAGKPFVLRVDSYWCIHPSLELVVHIGYSQRIPPKGKPIEMKSEGEKFMRSLRFTDLKSIMVKN